MLLALLPAALWLSATSVQACHAGQGYDGPPARPRPSEIILPAPGLAQNTARFTDEELARLNAAVDRISTQAPDWSLSVSRTDGAAWSHNPEGRVFAAASIGKSMTAALVFQLIEEGRLSAEDTLDAWRPDLPHAELVTIDDLLSHRSGYFIATDSPGSAPQSPDQLYARLQQDGVLFCPGTNWAYSNVGYMLLGDIIAATEGRSFAESLEARVLTPLGLEQTYAVETGRIRPDLIPGHHDGQVLPTADYAWPYAAAPVLSTAEDMVIWWRALLSGAVISEASLEQMSAEGWPLFGHDQLSYGRGVQIADFPVGPGAMLMHSGGITGFVSVVAWSPRHNVYVAAMANEKTTSAEAALWALMQALDAELPHEANN
jgi:D-alanyl-D-alanine carboxypeptidase